MNAMTCDRKTFRQAGVALLTAMLTVTLVATFAAAALWQQWRGIEVEAAERARVQSGWLLWRTGLGTPDLAGGRASR